jgi:hypothetical protein
MNEWVTVRTQGAAVAHRSVTQLTAAGAIPDGLAAQQPRDDAPATDVVETARDLVGLHGGRGCRSRAP